MLGTEARLFVIGPTVSTGPLSHVTPFIVGMEIEDITWAGEMDKTRIS